MRVFFSGINNFKRRGNRSSVASSQQDLYSPTSNGGGFINHAFSAGDLGDYGHQLADSVPQTPMTNSGSEIHLISPTSVEEKKRVFRYLYFLILTILFYLALV